MRSAGSAVEDPHVGEGLLHLELAFLDRARRPRAAVLEGAAQLREDAHALAQVDVRVEQVALQERPMRVLRVLPPAGVLLVVVAEPDLAADGEVARGCERDVLDGIQRALARARVAQTRVVLVVAELLERGRALGRGLAVRRAREARDRQNAKQPQPPHTTPRAERLP